MDIDLKKVIISGFFDFNFEMHCKSLRNGKTGSLEKKIKDNTVSNEIPIISHSVGNSA